MIAIGVGFFILLLAGSILGLATGRVAGDYDRDSEALAQLITRNTDP